jgi:hypothetical protein
VHIERRGGITVDAEGVATVGTATIITIAHPMVTPLSGRDRDLLPEGVRSREAISFFSTVPVVAAADVGDAADVVVYHPLGGTVGRYVVQLSEDWGHVSGHWRVSATREPRA